MAAHEAIARAVHDQRRARIARQARRNRRPTISRSACVAAVEADAAAPASPSATVSGDRLRQDRGSSARRPLLLEREDEPRGDAAPAGA